MRRNTLLAIASIVLAATMSACTVSNAGITTKVKSNLASDPAVNARAIQVTTNNGVVTLSGSADSQEAKDRAIALTKQTKGVVAVTDMIEVRNPSPVTPAEQQPPASGESAPNPPPNPGGTSE